MTMWAFQLQPAPQELLSGYLTRVAHAHGSTAGAFCRLHLGDSWYWTRDVDRGVAVAGHRRLSELAGLSMNDIEALTLCNWIEALTPASYRSRGPTAVTPWINAVGLAQARRRHGGLSYCPDCLAEQAVVPKAWRLAFHVRCEIHRRVLLDGCGRCGALFVPHLSRRSVAHCWSCGYLLTSCQSRSSCLVVEGGVAAQVQRLMGDLLTRSCAGDEAARHRSHALRVLVSVQWAGNAAAAAQAGANRVGSGRLELLPVAERTLVVGWLQSLLADWPQSFRKLAADGGHTQRTFARSGVQDAWLLDEIGRLPPGQRRNVTRRLDAVQRTLRMPLRHDVGNWRAQRARVLMQRAIYGH